MHIVQVRDNPVFIDLWEHYMQEPWKAYDGVDMFAVMDSGLIVGGFAVYEDESDGIRGTFCSGWTRRHTKVPVEAILHQLARNVGDIYFKTRKRAAKFLLEKIAKKVKNSDRYCYYIIRGK